MYYLSQQYGDHSEVILEAKSLDVVMNEFESAIMDNSYNTANDIESYDVWSDNPDDGVIDFHIV